MQERRFRDDDNGFWAAALISRVIVKVGAGLAGYVGRRYKTKKDAAFMATQYPQLHQQAFGLPPQWEPPSREEAVANLWRTGQENEASRPDYAVKCYQLALWVSDNKTVKKGIADRMSSVQIQDVSSQQQPNARTANPELMALGDMLLTISEQGAAKPSRPYYLDL